MSKFEVGQRVRDIGSEYTKNTEDESYIPVGSTGTVVANDCGIFYPILVEIDGWARDDTPFPYLERELEVIDD